MIKEKYIEQDFEIVLLANEDVITISNTDPGELPPDTNNWG